MISYYLRYILKIVYFGSNKTKTGPGFKTRTRALSAQLYFLNFLAYSYWPSGIAVPRGREHANVSALSSTSWGAIIAHQACHAKIGDELKLLGVEYFRPVEEKLRVVCGRRVRHYHPILGNYLLLSVTLKWRSVFSIKGVLGWIMNESGWPAQVLPCELQRLRELCPDGVARKSDQVIAGFKYGDKVMPNDGPFHFHVGTYEGKTRRGDAARFTLFGREQRVIFKPGTLVAA